VKAIRSIRYRCCYCAIQDLKGRSIVIAGDELTVHLPNLRRYARVLIRNRDLADDLVQDTLERTLRYAASFESDTDLRAWLFTIMHSQYANSFRRRSAHAIHIPIDDESLAYEALTISHSSSSRLELRDMDCALQSLPQEQRDVVVMVGIETMSYADTAQSLNIPVGTVMSRLARGRQRLRRSMLGIGQNPALQMAS
jgi:RNA polymerase sigma-70 factor (ECF subfamily)